ncbi:RING-type E3 ubiquitin transferase [Malassezia brasiliensis]|uniref:RING-type E3 ubiquitin transferase n=1 Tax=Malassezia brasiliensis TaxID=1821822 RepID=A0AAF0DU33_9BASI|nr:RING-type E3 ubiquitin transferase [Malassezia brasiliensis]
MAGVEAVPDVPTCRICRMEEEPGVPLYRPCRCSGSIQYCHQECLVQWLQHSQKTYCELCNYSFVFHKRYTHSMPPGTLPVWLYVRYIAWRATQTVTYVVRAAVVVFAWLLLVPYTTYRVWRMYFNVGDRIADAMLGTHIFRGSADAAHAAPWPALVWTSPHALLASLVALARRVFDELTETWLKSIIVTGSVVLSFVAVLLLREWVVHNVPEAPAPPEDDAPAPAEDAARERMRIAALATAQARAEHMLAADPAQMAYDDLARAALLQAPHAGAPVVEPGAPRPAPAGWGAVPDADEDEWTDDEPAGAPDAVGADDEWVDETDSEASHDADHAHDLAAHLDAHAVLPPAVREFDEEEDDEFGWDDVDGGDHFAEDIESVLEAVGLLGPFVNFLQTLALVQALAVSVITVFVAIPYCAGRLLGFRVLDLVLLPAQALRRVTDPVFEAVLAVVLAPVRWAWPAALEARTVPAAAPAAAFDAPALGVRATYVAPAARYVQALVARGIQMALGLQAHTRGVAAWERVLCVVLGHAYALLLLAAEAYGGALVHGVPMPWAKHVLKQYLLMAKVFAFSVIDLVLFPLFCGVLLEWCLFPLFPGASFRALAGDARAAPFTFTFTRWTSGTVYMFHFAQMLSAIRSVVRPGVMCWMRDAADPDFHPIREIVETRTPLQLRRIWDSVLMYGAVLVLVIGLGLRAACAALPGVLPLHWHPQRPVLHVPIDLILVHFGLRVAVKRTRLAHHAHRAFRAWWIAASKRLRLSAFLMGDEQPGERGFVPATWVDRVRHFVVPRTHPEHDPRFVHNGGYARVPADDHPAPDAQLIIPTNAAGIPIDAAAQAAFEAQQRAIVQMKERAAYTIVYLPPHLYGRIVALIVMLWLSCAVVSVAAFVTPLVVGRTIASLCGRHGMHDVYAIMLGLMALVAATLVRHCVTQLRLPGERRLAKGAAATARVAYVLLAFGTLVPFLVGLVAHQYVVPTQRTIDGVPQLNVFHAWALGVVAMNCALLVILTVFPDDYPMLWDAYDFLHHGRIWRINVAHATRYALLPMLATLLLALVAPYLVATAALVLGGKLGAPADVQQRILRLANAAVLLVALGVVAARALPSRLGIWTDVLRDELFLESTELCNYNEADEKLAPRDGYGPLPDRLVRG